MAPFDVFTISLLLASIGYGKNTVYVQATLPLAGEQCEVCEQIVDILLRANERESLVERIFPDCLSNTKESYCQHAVALDKVIKLKGTHSSRQLCSVREFCDDVKGIGDDLRLLNSNATCDLCELVLEKIAHSLPRNFTIGDLVDFLFHECRRLRIGNYDKLVQKCEFLANIYAPEIYNGITGRIPPNQVCRYAYLCPWPAALALNRTP